MSTSLGDAEMDASSSSFADSASPSPASTPSGALMSAASRSSTGAGAAAAAPAAPHPERHHARTTPNNAPAEDDADTDGAATDATTDATQSNASPPLPPARITDNAHACVISPPLRVLKELGLELFSLESLTWVMRAVLTNQLGAMKQDDAAWAKDAALVNAKDDMGRTALRLATEVLNVEAVALLLKAKADPNLVDVAGRSPLHAAAALRDRVVCGMLMEAGAADVADAGGVTPLMEACRSGAWETVTDMLSRASPPRFDASKRESRRGMGVLHAAISRASAGSAPFALALAELLQHGADVHCVDAKTGWTPLHLAASHGLAETVALLVQRGAKVDATDAKGRTPLIVAVEVAALHPRVKQVVRTLLDSGASASAKDASGRTASDVCASWLARDGKDVSFSQAQSVHLQVLQRLMVSRSAPSSSSSSSQKQAQAQAQAQAQSQAR